MQITSENGFKNALIYQKLWPKQVTENFFGHFLCILSLFWVENMDSRGSTSNVSSEQIFMFLEPGGPGEWGQLQSLFKIKLFKFFPPPWVV